MLWAALVAIYPFVYYMKVKYADKHKLCSIWNHADSKYKYTLILRGVIMSYASMFLACFLNIFTLSFTSMANVASTFSAITFMLVLVYLPIQLMNILQNNYRRISTAKFMRQYSTIIKEMDTKSTLRYMFYPVFLIRRAIFVSLLVFFANSPI